MNELTFHIKLSNVSNSRRNIMLTLLKRHIISVAVFSALFGVMACKPGVTDNFKIISYNVWQGYHDGNHMRFPVSKNGQERKEGIYNWLRHQDPDVVVFQELMNYTSDQLEQESHY